jgi:hypothetical protein
VPDHLSNLDVSEVGYRQLSLISSGSQPWNASQEVGQLAKQRKSSMNTENHGKNIVQSCPFSYPRGRSPLSLISSTISTTLQDFCFSYSHRSIRSRHPARFGTYICPRLQKISFSLQHSLVQKPEAYSHPHRRWAARCFILLVWTSRCRGKVTAQLLIPYH